MTNLAKRLPLLVVRAFGTGLHPANAQVQAINGSIQGDVFDSAGAVVPAADVEADEVETATVHRSITDGAGHFAFPSLQPGRYQVFDFSGFLRVGVGDPRQAQLALRFKF